MRSSTTRWSSRSLKNGGRTTRQRATKGCWYIFQQGPWSEVCPFPYTSFPRNTPWKQLFHGCSTLRLVVVDVGERLAQMCIKLYETDAEACLAQARLSASVSVCVSIRMCVCLSVSVSVCDCVCGCPDTQRRDRPHTTPPSAEFWRSAAGKGTL
jgi:hypothetical protein